MVQAVFREVKGSIMPKLRTPLPLCFLVFIELAGLPSSTAALPADQDAAVDRLVHGNPGPHRVLTDGVAELKIDFGPGYRVYYTQRGEELIVLLAGGDKSSQQQDIKSAIALARNLQE